MKILARGTGIQLDELGPRLKGHSADYFEPNVPIAQLPLEDYDVVFDMLLEDQAFLLSTYAGLQGKVVVGGAVKRNLASMAASISQPMLCHLIGMNAHPTFINRDKIEISVFNQSSKPVMENILSNLDWDCQWVADRVGMVSPRLVYAVINEGFFTSQEGTASPDEIDEAMKLGVNYPQGPFEWLSKIGVRYVYETLEALQADTHDGRYKPCPQLKSLYLRTR